MPTPLTQRQRDCLRLLAEGKGRREIAKELGIAVGTVNGHVLAARMKLGADSVAEAWRKLGWLRAA